jgi:hypothetical protein
MVAANDSTVTPNAIQPAAWSRCRRGKRVQHKNLDLSELQVRIDGTTRETLMLFFMPSRANEDGIYSASL